MRVYLPSTLVRLQAALAAGEVDVPGGIAFGVTPALRAEYSGGDEEEYEYLAMHDAAVGSLRLLAAGSDGTVVAEAAGGPFVGSAVGSAGAAGFPALRVVIAADVEGAGQRPDLDRAAIHLDGPVPWSAVAAVHLDSADAAPVILAAAAAVDDADLGDPDAEFALGSAEDIELCWYDPSEIGFLVAELGG